MDNLFNPTMTSLSIFPLNNLIEVIEKWAGQLENGMGKTVGAIDLLNERLSIFCTNQKYLLLQIETEKMPTAADRSDKVWDKEANSKKRIRVVNESDHVYQRANVAEEKMQNSSHRESKGFTEVLAGISKVTESVSKTIESLGTSIKNGPALAKGAGMIGNVAELTKGAYELSKVNESDHPILNGTVIVANMMKNATQLASLAAEFGPEGWGIAIAAMVVAEGVGQVVQYQENKQKMAAKESGKRKAALKTFDIPEYDADQYINHIDQIKALKIEQKEGSKKESKLHYFPIAENIKKFGSDAYALNIPVPLAKSDQVAVPHVYVPRRRYNNDEDQLPVKQSYMEQTFDLQEQLKEAGLRGGIGEFSRAAALANSKASDFDKEHNTTTLLQTQAAGEDAAYALFMMAKKEKMDVGAEARGPGLGDREHRRGATIINVNKPLIERFVINTNTVNEGLASFKHRVEEVLIEILNSANTIDK